MKIRDDHMFHGAALIQIAEHPRFTAINSLVVGKKKSRDAYRINNNSGVALKYANKLTRAYREHTFTFTRSNLRELKQISKAVKRLFIAMVCVKGKEICCISHDDLTKIVNERFKITGKKENQYVLLVRVIDGKKLRLYQNFPGKRKKIIKPERLVSRNAFPKMLFEKTK